MGRDDIITARHNVLDRINKELNEDKIAAVFQASEDGAPETVSVLFDEMGEEGEGEAAGQIFFRPFTSSEDKVQYFAAILTPWEDIPKDRLPALYEAISYVNFTLPAGCFTVDKDHSFCTFILSAPLPIDLPEEELLDRAETVLGSAVATADAFFDILTDVVDGKKTVKDVVAFLEE
ncbi:MAG: YbjN domain-containing protein [Lachnospiraceae bacterium]|nr:YbjN domain-containing protein [Lachnospiraceae bacterium]